MGKAPVKAGVWVLTSEHNDYDQHGEYFHAVWAEKPTLGQLAEYFAKESIKPSSTTNNVMEAVAFLEHLLKSGGRRGLEDVWWNLEFEEFQK